MKREELKVDKAIDWTLTHDKYIYFYHKSEADSVMDAMEARIKELKNKNKNLQYSSDMWMACCKLMSEGKRNVMSSDAIAEMNRIKELEAENERLRQANLDGLAHFDTLKEDYARLKAMKWISVDDVKPQWGKEVKVKFKDGSEDEVRFSHDYKWVSKGMGTCESSEVTHWMPLPTTEESSETEN